MSTEIKTIAVVGAGTMGQGIVQVLAQHGFNVLAFDAVEGAVAIQRALQTRNAELPSERQMTYRIGINVGDVVVEGEQIYGDGVNIAARVEGLAASLRAAVAGDTGSKGRAKGLADLALLSRAARAISQQGRVIRGGVAGDRGDGGGADGADARAAQGAAGRGEHAALH